MHFHNHPILGFILAGLLTATGFGIGGDLHLQVENPIQEVGLPLWLKDTFQCAAWTGAFITGVVAGWGFYVKTILPAIESWKKKRRSRKK